MTKDINSSLKKLENFAYLLDARFKIPYLNIRVGWDALIGLLPIAGDTATLIFSLIWVYRASKLNISGRVITIMLLRVLLDYLIGTVPILGDIFDIFYKANRKNLQSLRHELNKKHTPRT